MIDLNLEEDERVILDCEKLRWVSDNNRLLDNLILTNKGIYCIYQVKNGLFAKTEDMIYRFELSDIIVDDNNYSQIRQTKVRGDHCLEIRFKHGMEYFSFERLPKTVLTNWIAAMNDILGTEDPAIAQRAQNQELLGNIAGQVVDGLANIFGTRSDTIYSKIEKVSGKTISRTSGRTVTFGRHAAGKSPAKTIYCIECGTKLTEENSYCSKCGTKVILSTFHVALDGQPQGPFDAVAIKKMAAQGKITRDTLMWTKGMEKWLPIDEIEDLKDIAATLPPKL